MRSKRSITPCRRLVAIAVLVVGCSLASPAVAMAEHDSGSFPQPPHDFCSNSLLVNVNQTYEGQVNTGASGAECSQPSEIATCPGPFGHTVWYALDVPSKGTLSVATTGASNVRTDPVTGDFYALDTVVGLYTQTQFLACNDNATAGVDAGSALTVEVQAGRHYLQVGGANYGPPFNAPDTGYFQLSLSFRADPDRDDDGASPPSDCDDDNPARKPGLPDIGVNGIDDDCDQVTDPDKDSDGHKARPHGRDCDDTPGPGQGINPEAREIRGNKVDENCDRKKSPFRQIDADVDYGADRFSWGIVITSPLTLDGVPGGGQSTVLCFKPSGRPCGRFGPTQKRSFPQLRGRRLAAKSVLIIYVSKRRHIGRYIKITVRGGQRKPKKIVRCTNPGSSKPRKLGKCPGRR